MNNSSPLVSIIVVNWNGRKFLSECLDAILRQTYPNFEIILVDNASTDGSAEYVQLQYPSVKTVRLAENTGFTGGNIAGLAHAAGAAIVLLNNDAVLTEHWLEAMVEGLYSDPGIGFCSARTVIAGTELIDSIGDTFTTAFSGTKMGEYEPADRYTTRRLVPGAYAAAAMYRREMLDRIGFLDEDFFFNHEDTDLHLRAWLSGWKCLFVPEAVVYHKVSASVGELSEMGVYYFSRNSVWTWLKNTPSWFVFRSIPQRILYELSSFFFYCIIHGRCRPFLRGKIDAVKKIPLMLRKREETQRLVCLSRSEIAAGLMPITKYLMLRLRNVR